MQDTLLKNAYDLHRAGRIDDAARLYADILRVSPRHFDALYSLAIAHSQSGRIEEAQSVMAEALAVNPQSVEACYARGCLLHRLNRLDEAIASYDRALALRPDFIDALNNRGGAFGALNRHEDALASFDRALAFRSDNPQMFTNRANALLVLGRFTESLASFDRAISLNPRAANAICNRGAAFMGLQRYEEALASFDRALAIEPNFVEALAHRGVLLSQLGRCDEAIVNFNKALALSPDRADIRYNRGNALAQLRHFEAAVPDFDEALRGMPQNVDLLYSRGNALAVLKRYDEAIRDCEKVLAIDPDYRYARGILMHSRLQCCDWRNFEEERIRIASGLRAGRRMLSPFDNGAISQSAEEQLNCARIWTADICPPAPEPVWRGERYRHDKIRVAYLSADYRAHPVAFQMAGVFEAHDRERFDISAVSFTPEHTSPFRTRLEAAFSRFVSVRDKNDLEVARMLKDWEIDIAVDLTGWTRECRTGIFAQRAAPLQVNYLGYPGTMGGDYYDYIIADSIVVPEEHGIFYSEKIARLPGSFMPNDSKRAAIGRPPTRGEAGLPQTGFVFCCFNGTYKIAPDIFDVWMRLLRAVEGSVLWLPKPNDTAARNLGREAEALGISAERILFAPFVGETEDHLARLKLADLFLDTMPYGAHSTACDALWVGLPVTTCLGNTFAGRVAASVLRCAGLPELVTRTLEDYEALALRLARNPAALADIKAKVETSRTASPLFDTKGFCGDLENAYTTMWERHMRGEAPSDFAVTSPQRGAA